VGTRSDQVSVTVAQRGGFMETKEVFIGFDVSKTVFLKQTFQKMGFFYHESCEHFKSLCVFLKLLLLQFHHWQVSQPLMWQLEGQLQVARHTS